MAIINGTAGNDTRIGTADADTINGFAGNDTITGGLGNDLARMGAGNDTFIWHADDGDDVLRGQDGFDTLVFEGFVTSELIGIGRNASRVSVAEFFGNILDLDDVERVFVRALAGSDGVFIDNLAGTDLKQVVVDLAGTVGGIGGDGEVDGVVRSGGDGNDVFNVALASGIVSITGPSAAVTIRNADKDDILELNGDEGNDAINASKLPANVMQLSINGDDGNDTITGSRGNDELDGDDGNDVVAGGRGNDLVDLGAGNDVFARSQGDGEDTVQGGDGIDTVRITTTEGFAVVDNEVDPSKVEMYKLVGDILVAHLVTAENIERIQVRAVGGADVVAVEDLGGAGVREVSIDLAASAGGTVADANADTVRLLASGGSNAIAIERAGSNFIVSGFSQKISIGHASNKDTLWIQSQSGNDVIDASALAAGKIKLKLEGGLGDDVFFGSGGNDTATGGEGHDVALLGSGNDTFSGDQGDDVAHMGAGNDRYNWSVGGGNDTVIGGTGIDTFVYRDQNAGPPLSDFTIEADAGRVRFSRIGGEAISLNAIERLRVIVGGGIDHIDVNDLAGTGVKLVAIDLAAPGGTGIGDGVGDSVNVAGTAGNDLVTIGQFAGGVSITGLPAQVTITHTDSGAPNDVLRVSGGDGNDTINASAMPDAIVASFDGGNGNDNIRGGTGPEEISGDAGNDTLRGSSNFDFLVGGAGNDFLDGGTGKDALDGGTGNDVLVGGRGNDEMLCGDGADRVKYTSVLDGHDVILDFDGDPAGGQDVLDLDALFDSLGIAASKRAGLVDINDLGGTVEISVNADGKAGFELHVATLTTADLITKGQDVFVGT